KTGIEDVAISNDGYYIALVNDSYVYLFNRTITQTKTYEWRYNVTADAKEVLISDNGNYLVVRNSENEIYLFNTTYYNDIPMWNFTSTAPLYRLAISEDGSYIAVCGSNYVYYLNNTYYSGSKKEIWLYQLGDPSRDVDITNDGKYIILGTTGAPTLHLLNNTKTSPKSSQWSTLQEVRAVAISAKGEYFVSSTDVAPYQLRLYHHHIPSPLGYIPIHGDDDDDDDEDNMGLIILGIIVFGCVGAGFAVIIVLIKKGIIGMSKTPATR
ncbi:MAG: WD40 repeat domain-containing protein, partial [Promethearchaeota archaeon]